MMIVMMPTGTQTSAVPTAGRMEATPVSAAQTSALSTPKIQYPIQAVTPW